MKALTTAATLALSLLTVPAFAQEHASHKGQATPLAQVFEHYEAVRQALSADNLTDVAPHAKQLAAGVEPIGDAEAKKAAEALVAAATMEEARKQFGELSTILVPRFQEAKVPGATAFMCAMKKQPWMQRGDTAANPYYGKSMLTCGSPMKPTGK